VVGWGSRVLGEAGLGCEGSGVGSQSEKGQWVASMACGQVSLPRIPGVGCLVGMEVKWARFGRLAGDSGCWVLS
jgi:hypothetical protein